MDAAFVIDCALFTAQIYVSRFLYKLCKKNGECLKSLKEAQCFEIGSKLLKEVEKNDGVIEYAVISGSVKALTNPLRSQYDSTCLQGVIQEKVIKGRKWIPFFGSWSLASDLQRTINYVPFALCNNTSGLFKKQMCVEVIEPVTAREIILPNVYDKFIFYNMLVHPNSTLGDATFGFFCSEKLKTVQVEGMLSEGMTLTAVGKLVIENSKLKIKRPDSDFTYFLTPLTIRSLIDKFYVYTILSRILFIAMCTLTFTFFIYISRRVISKIKRKKIMNWQRKRLEEVRNLRIANKSCGQQDSDIPKCVVCLEYQVEVLLLECGHACLCFDCSNRVKNFCPVCRDPIVQTVLAFLP